MTSKQYCAIIGDIRKSRSLPRRASVQRKFAAAIEKVNVEYRPEVASKFLLTLGDEFQGLLISPTESYRLVRRFQDLMEPISFSFGVGVGALSTPVKKDALGMDGEAFHRARAALNEAKKSKREVLYSFDSQTLDITNALVGLLEGEWHRLTARQKQIAQLLKELDGQEAVANRLRISQPAVSKVVSTLRNMTEAENALHEFFRRRQIRT
ncbi:MAG TPA: SatD family protein [Bacteroidota bacterium]